MLHAEARLLWRFMHTKALAELVVMLVSKERALAGRENEPASLHTVYIPLHLNGRSLCCTQEQGCSGA